MTVHRQLAYTDETVLRGPREASATSLSTPTPNANNTDLFILTAQAETAFFGAPTGSPKNGQKLMFRIKDNGTPQTLHWNAIYASDALPNITIAHNTLYIACIYNEDEEKWDVAINGNVPAPTEDDNEVRYAFSWGTVSSVLLDQVTSGQLVRSIEIIVFEAFNGVGAAVTIGTDDDHDLLAAVTDMDLKTVGTYIINPGYKFLVDTDVKMFHTPGAGASSGNGIVIINF